MTLQIGRFTPYTHLAAATQARTDPFTPADRPKPAVVASGTVVGDIPPAPTPEARALVAKAAEVVQRLHDNNRELHFSTDAHTHRVVIEVRDLDGNVIKTIPPSKALDIMSRDAEL
jgi:flagellar protein FlaG